jgi:hypothetical protein
MDTYRQVCPSPTLPRFAREGATPVAHLLILLFRYRSQQLIADVSVHSLHPCEAWESKYPDAPRGLPPPLRSGGGLGRGQYTHHDA